MSGGGPRRLELGTWAFPSGNRCEVEIEQEANLIHLYWDSPPPLHRDDCAHYESVVRTAIIRRLTDYLGEPGARVLVAL